MTKVVFPCDQSTWWQVKAALHNLKDLCCQEDVDWVELAEAHQAIVHKNKGYGDNMETEFETSTFYGLVKFFNNPAFSCEEEADHFRKSTLPSIIDLALKIEELLPIEGLCVSPQQKAGVQKIDRQLCCSILACAFLCLFPEENRPFGTKLPKFNFNNFFSHLHIPSQIAKLRCVLNYFDRTFAEWAQLKSSVIFTRQVIKWDELPTLDTWLNCYMGLCEVLVRTDGSIEDAGHDTVEVDFANRYIGGGVLSRGRVQEEIRFSLCPELMVAMLFMEAMEDNEAIMIKGFEQFSFTVGYASDLIYAGDYRDLTTLDGDGSLKRMLCAIDAVSYRHNAQLQYTDSYILRDLNKAFIGFCTPFPLEETLSEESYKTAEEETDVWKYNNDQEWSARVNQFVEEILRQAVSQALPEAASLSRYNKQPNKPQTDEANMSHLEVNFREWYANYRRRSSNLSDISSRRSSGCSTRGYSSEFSSEFEEYYDNFQLQESRYKYHTIKEESGSAVVNEFAANLVMSLLQEGTRVACSVDKGLHDFNGAPPDHVIHQPQAHWASVSQEASDESSDDDGDDDDDDDDDADDNIEDEDNYEKDLNYEVVQMFVDRLFQQIWPFREIDSDSCDSGDDKSDDYDEPQALLERIVCGINTLNSVANTQEESFNETEDTSEYEGSSDQENNNCSVSDDKTSVIDDAVLKYVAERIVALAFDEALADYRYRYLMPPRRFDSQLSIESSMSDHSTEHKDQSEGSKTSLCPETSQSETSNKSAEKVAQKVLQGLFADVVTNDSSVERDQKSLVSSMDVETIPKFSDCDTGKGTCVEHVHQSSSPHSSSKSDKDVQSLVSSERHLQMYSRIADKLIMGGFSAIGVDHDPPHTLDVKTKSVSQSERNRSSSFSALKDGKRGSTKKVLSRGVSCDQSVDQSQSPDSKTLDVPLKLTSDIVSSQPLLNVNQALSNTSKPTGYSRKTPTMMSRSSSLKSPSNRLADKRNSSSSSSDGRCQSDGSHNHLNKRSSSSSSEGKCPIDLCSSKRSDRLDFPHSPPRSGNSSLPGNQTFENETTGSDDQVSGSKSPAGNQVHLSAGEKRSVYVGGARPKTYLQPPEAHYRPLGNKKNYDQFANSLSRDLLTNAFLQVQEQSDQVVTYPRRSSEPMQISNGAALQRLEESMNAMDGRVHPKSKTDEDICLVEQSWAQNGPFCNGEYRGGSSPYGFKDPVLSRFAEELMKANVSIPTLQLLSDCVSTTGSSRSVCSTLSSFRDPLLASFEEELLSCPPGTNKSAARTQMSWSKMKGTILSQKVERKNSQNASNNARKSRVNSISMDSEASGISWKSFKSSNVVICSEDVSNFAEMLSRRIVCEALTATFCADKDVTSDNCAMTRRQMITIEMYGEMLACHILQSALNAAQSHMTASWIEQNKIVTWSEETECLEYSGEGSSGDSDNDCCVDGSRGPRDSVASLSEYEDALDVPYQRLEEFASMLAEQVIMNSLAMSQRERSCLLRRQYGRPIATGNWGCGSFGGDPQLKSLIQWMAASYAGAPKVIFYTFGHYKMNRFQEVIELVTHQGWDISQLMQAVRRYCLVTENEINTTGQASHDLFDVILQGEIFPGL